MTHRSANPAVGTQTPLATTRLFRANLLRVPTGRRGGFSFIEMLTAFTVMGILASIATRGTFSTIDQARIAKAIGDIKAIQTELNAYEAEGRPLPNALADLGRGAALDPWGRPYQYLPFPAGGGPAATACDTGAFPGGVRVDRFAVPVNCSFDLYSLGKDGVTAPDFSSGSAQDDIVRANDGGYIGTARRF